MVCTPLRSASRRICSSSTVYRRHGTDHQNTLRRVPYPDARIATRTCSRILSRPASSGGGVPAPGAYGFRTGSINIATLASLCHMDNSVKSVLNGEAGLIPAATSTERIHPTTNRIAVAGGAGPRNSADLRLPIAHRYSDEVEDSVVPAAGVSVWEIALLKGGVFLDAVRDRVVSGCELFKAVRFHSL